MVVCVLRQFQCRQCQDLLENNVAHKRPIEGNNSSHSILPFYERLTTLLLYLQSSSARRTSKCAR